MSFQKVLINSLQNNSEKVAIEEAGKEISYESLLNNSNRVTHFLLKNGIRQGTIIGIDVTNRTNLITAMIGVINAGGIFVLLDRSLPASRLKHMAEDLNLQYLISSDTSSALENSVDKLFALDDIFEMDVKDQAMDQLECRGEDSLYIYFTSGSTGTPKGIIGKSDSLLQFVQWEIKTFNLQENYRVSQFISPYFDAFLRDVFVPLLCGGTICIPPDDEDFFTFSNIIPWINASKIDIIHCVPSVFQIINDSSLLPEYFDKLKYIFLSGEKIIPLSLKNWYEKFGDRITLVNLYGLTESTMIKSYYVISREDLKKARLPIGKPITDASLLISKRDFKPCNSLVPGDLFIISDNLTKGYLNNPELTHEKFLSYRDANGHIKTALRTGDKARRMMNGDIELLGREDRQVKLRGIRIELDEIETILAKSNLTKNQFVVIHGDETKGKSLFAFITKKEGALEEEKLKEILFSYLRKNLPTYMIPADIIILEQLPLLSNGKIDKKELFNYLALQKELILPETPVEGRLYTIWKGILGQREISIEDTFYEIGGNSLSMIELIAKIYKEFDVQFKINELFHYPTIKRQAEFIAKAQKVKVKKGIPISPPKEHYELTSSQKRLYFLHEYDQTSLAFNLPQFCILHGELDRVKLENVINSLLARHESLRTSFELVNGEPKQIIANEAFLAIEVFSAGEEDKEEIIKKFVKPFDLKNGPLLRVGLIAVSNEENILMFDMHHIIADDISEKILLRDFMSLYNDESLAPLPLSFKDYAEWIQKDEFQTIILKERKFWLNIFKDKPQPLELPTDFAWPSQKSYEGKILVDYIEKEQAEKLKELCDQEGVTMFMFLMAIFSILVSKLGGREDTIIGTPIAGRSYPDLDDLVGLFTNTIPLRYFPKKELSFRTFLAHVKSHTLGGLDHQNYPYENLVDDLQIERNTSRNPLFDLMLAYLNYESKELKIPGLTLKAYERDQKESKLALSLFVYNAFDGIQLNYEYSTDLFREETIDKYRLLFRKIISTVLENREVEIGQIEIAAPLTPVESSVAITPPTNPLEKKLIEIWSSVFDLPQNQVGITKSIWSLNGNSSQATLLANRVYRDFGVNVSVDAVFKHPDIKSFSKHLIKQARGKYRPIVKSDNKPIYPLSLLQKQVFDHYKPKTPNAENNICRVYRIEGELDLNTLQSALRALTNRHEMLRAQFSMVDNESSYFLNEDIQVEIESLGYNNRNILSIAKDFTHSFDLSKAPLVRVGHVTVSPSSSFLLIDMHRIIADNMSHDIFMQDLMGLYQGRELSNISHHFSDFVSWQEATLVDENLAQKREYWMGQFSENPVDIVFYEGSQNSAELEHYRTEFNYPLVEALNSLSRMSETNRHMLFMALMSVFYSKLTNKEDLIIGVPIIGRRHCNLEHLIGPFENTIPLRIQIQNTLSIKSLLEEIKSKWILAIDNYEYPLGEIVDTIGLTPNPGRPSYPMYDVVFDFQSIFSRTYSKPELDIKQVEFVNPSILSHLQVTTFQAEGELVSHVLYTKGSIDGKDVAYKIENLDHILSKLLQEVETPIHEIDFLPNEESVIL